MKKTGWIRIIPAMVALLALGISLTGGCAQGGPVTNPGDPVTAQPANVHGLTGGGGNIVSPSHRATVALSSSSAVHDLRSSHFRLRIGIGEQLAAAAARPGVRP